MPISPLNRSLRVAEFFFFFLSFIEKQGRIHDTISRGGWAGAVITRAGAVGEAVYTKASVACDRAGAVMQKPLAKCQKSKGVTNGPTD